MIKKIIILIHFFVTISSLSFVGASFLYGVNHYHYFIIQINNVGTLTSKPATEFTAQDFSSQIATNLESAYHLSQLAHPLLKASGFGSIVFMSSVCGVVSAGTVSIYSLTKGS